MPSPPTVTLQFVPGWESPRDGANDVAIIAQNQKQAILGAALFFFYLEGEERVTVGRVKPPVLFSHSINLFIYSVEYSLSHVVSLSFIIQVYFFLVSHVVAALRMSFITVWKYNSCLEHLHAAKGSFYKTPWYYLCLRLQWQAMQGTAIFRGRAGSKLVFIFSLSSVGPEHKVA